ncbi:MAG: O-antigen ligase family protein [Anaerolineae bacterium]
MSTLFELTCILTALGLFASAKTYQPVMAGGLALLASAGLARLARRRRLIEPTPLDRPLALFLLSGLIGLAVTYDLGTSLARFCLILGGVALYYAVSGASFRVRLAVAGGLVLFASALALYLVTQQNPLAQVGAGKFAPLGAVAASIRDRAPQLHLYQPHPNIVAGVLEVGLITGAGLLGIARRASWLMSGLLAAGLGLIGFGLLLSGARGAWLAAGLAGLGWALSDMRRANRLRTLDALALALILGSTLLLLLLAFRGPGELPLAGRLASRLELYNSAGRLVRDYALTGAGLGTFPLLYSAYVLGIDVVKQNHAHNLYLSVWLEQGLLGLIALLWLGFAFFRAYWPPLIPLAPFSPRLQGEKGERRPKSALDPLDRRRTQAQRLLASAAFWAMVAVFVHGLIDSTHYNSRFLFVVFIPLGLAGALRQQRYRNSRLHLHQCLTGSSSSYLSLRSSRPTPGVGVRAWRPALARSGNVALGTLGGVLLLALLVWGRTPVLAVWYANLGAVAQAKIELGDYRWPDRIPSRVRATADLSGPRRYFEQTLALSPDNATARERLEMIRLAESRK